MYKRRIPAMARSHAIFCILLLVTRSSFVTTVSLKNPGDQWAGNCYNSCGKTLDRYCERETGRCIECVVWCLPTQDFAEDEKCRQKCPAYWAYYHPEPIFTTVTTETDTAVFLTTLGPTSKNHILIESDTTNPTLESRLPSSSLHSTNPTPSPGNFNWWVFALAMAIFLGFCVIAVVVTAVIWIISGKRKHDREDSENNRQTPVTTTGEGRSEGAEGYHILSQEETNQDKGESRDPRDANQTEDRIQEEDYDKRPKTDQTSRFKNQLPYSVAEEAQTNMTEETIL